LRESPCAETWGPTHQAVSVQDQQSPVISWNREPFLLGPQAREGMSKETGKGGDDTFSCPHT